MMFEPMIDWLIRRSQLTCLSLPYSLNGLQTAGICRLGIVGLSDTTNHVAKDTTDNGRQRCYNVYEFRGCGWDGQRPSARPLSGLPLWEWVQQMMGGVSDSVMMVGRLLPWGKSVWGGLPPWEECEKGDKGGLPPSDSGVIDPYYRPP